MASHAPFSAFSFQNSTAVDEDTHRPPDLDIPFQSSPATAARGAQMSSFVSIPALPLGGCDRRASFYWIVLVLTSLPCAAAATPDPSHPVENNKSTAVLIVIIPLGIFFAISSYLAELKTTCELPENRPELPNPVCHPIDDDLDPYRYRKLVLHAPAIVWLLLSVTVIGMTGLFWHSADSLDRCNTLNPDIAGIGSRVSLWVPGVIVTLMAGLGHYHAEETGVKSVNVSLILAQIIYGWNLWTKATSAVDRLAGAMILDCLISITSITFSMKECLAARQLIRVGHVVQFFSLFALLVVMTKSHYTSSKVSSDSCPCFQAYWWGPFDSCTGASATFWLYFTLKSLAVAHSSWLCFWHMMYYDAAEKSQRNDKNTLIKNIGDTVYDSIPATAFTKYLEWIPVAVSSIINIEMTLKGSQVQGGEDSSSWGQTAQILVAIVAIVCFSYAIYSMFKTKNVERRQTVLNRSSVGSMIPKFPIHMSDRRWYWIQNLPAAVRDHHPFARLALRSTNHSRMEFKLVAWGTIVKQFRRWPDETSRELGVRLVKEARFGDINVIEALLLEGASIDETDHDGSTALHIAAGGGHGKVVELLLASIRFTSVQDVNGRTALHSAARNGHDRVVELLLDSTTDTSIQDKGGWTALHIAVSNDHERVVELLLASTADTSIQDKDGWTALHRAADNGQEKVVELLLASNTDTSTQDEDGWTALHRAADNGHERVVELLLASTTDTSIQDEDGWTALHIAASNGYEMVIELLLASTTDTSIQDNGGWTALHMAISSGHDKVVELLLASTTDTSIQDEDGWTALHIAAGNGYEKLVELLLASTTDTSIQDKGGWTALHMAVSSGHDKVVELLLASTTNTSIQDKDGWTALHFAARGGRGKVVELLLASTTDTSIQDNYGRTALHVAAEGGLEKVVELLLKSTADTSIQDKGGWTALHTAVISGHDEVVKLLLASTSDTSIQSKNGWTALHIAAGSDHKKAVELLLASTTDTSIQDKGGRTPLHIAARKGHGKVVELLLASATDTSIQDKDGKTALHLAAQYGFENEVALLASATSTSTQANDGKTALHLAAEGGHVKVTNLLLKATNIDIQDNKGETVLHKAISRAKLDDALKIAENFLKNFASIGGVTQYNNGTTSTPIAASWDHQGMTKLLVEKCTDRKKGTVVRRIVILGLEKLAGVFLEGYDDITAQDSRGRTLLHYASCNRVNGPKLMGLLLNKTIRINQQDKDGRTALHNAALGGCQDTLKLLLERGADALIRDDHGKTARQLASENGHSTITEFLDSEKRKAISENGDEFEAS